jgi:hypothetical protein
LGYNLWFSFTRFHRFDNLEREERERESEREREGSEFYWYDASDMKICPIATRVEELTSQCPSFLSISILMNTFIRQRQKYKEIKSIKVQ